MVKLVGTSGYDYKMWIDYSPAHKIYYSSSKDKFKKYCSDFNFLELNNTFYRVPSISNIQTMYKNSPANFKFLTKFSQYITHSTRFKKFNDGWAKFMTPISQLKEKLAGVLFQFSKTFHYTPENVSLFREANNYILKNEEKYGKVVIYIELRDSSWFCQEGINLLSELEWVTVISSNFFGNMPPDFVITKPNYTMFRFHGLDRHCWGDYPDDILQYYVDLSKNIENVIFAFNNTDTLVGQIYPTTEIFGQDEEDKKITIPYRLLRRDVTQNTPHAIKNAKTIQEMLLDSQKYSLKNIFDYTLLELQDFTKQKTNDIKELRYLSVCILYENNLFNNFDTNLITKNREQFKSLLDNSNTFEELKL